MFTQFKMEDKVLESEYEGTSKLEDTECELFPGFKDASAYSQFLLRDVVQATKASNALPTPGDQYDFYQSFKGFRHLMRKEGKELLSMMKTVTQLQGESGYFEGKELEDMVDQLITVNDAVLEKVSSEMDDAAGLKKKETEVVLSTVRKTKIINTSWNRKDSRKSQFSYQLLAAKYVLRPQLKFQDLIDNSNGPFVPIIKEKPNSIKPLAILLESFNGEEEYSHPYELEIEKFSPSEAHLNAKNPEQPLPIERTELVVIDKVEDLRTLCEELKKHAEIAVDLEHHSYRTFQGITCLMQISTRDRDYIIDTIELRREMHLLNDIFTDPKIVKVLHGADMDVMWLQRDLGIYIVNLFDTGQAARMLNFAHFSLQYITSHYCKVNLNKQFQLADWRIRPLPSEMLLYAREDTHSLLFIYDQMKNELLGRGNEQKNLLRAVFENSKNLCLKRYKKPIFNENSHLELYRKSKKTFNARQLYALKQLFAWRDKIARNEDESTGYVLPNHMLLQISEVLPREQQGILACCNPIPPFVKQQLNELHAIIYRAREHPLDKLEVPESHLKVVSSHAFGRRSFDNNNPLRCPHDLPNSEETDLPTLLDSKCQKLSRATAKLRKKSADVAIFYSSEGEESVTKDGTEHVRSMFKDFISPYERYKASKAKNLMEPVQQIPEPEPANSGPTDEERIERIQQYYKNLVATATQEPAEEEEERILPLRHRRGGATARKRKRKNKSFMSSEKKMRRSDEQEEDFPSTSFQPFNYSNQTLQSGTSQRQPFSQNKKNRGGRAGRGVRRGKKNRGKQMSYKRDSSAQTRQKWPRR